MSDTTLNLAVNAYGGAAYGTVLKLVNNCNPSITDCTWTYHKGMLLSDTNAGLAVNAYGGAANGTVLKLVNNCTANISDCTWSYQHGMWVSDSNPSLAVNAYGGATNGTTLTLVNNCAPNITDCAWTYTGRSAKPLKGWVDLHTHPLSYLGFGGKLIYGAVDVGSTLPPVSPPPFGSCNTTPVAATEADALSGENQVHGGYGTDNACGDSIRYQVIQNLEQQLQAANFTDDTFKTSGWPNFPTWPTWDDVVDQKMWVEWIRRSYQGGLRVMVALAVNNKLLADMTRGPGDLPGDDFTSADLQIAAIKSFVGRHSDFMQIAYNSNDLYNIVWLNKLAVVIGVEIDNIGNLTGNVPGSALVTEVDRLYGEGVRYIFPVHLVDNPIGGAAAYNDLFNVANVYEEGTGYTLGCADQASNISYNYNPPSVWIQVGAFAKLKTNTPGLPPPVPCPTGNVNTRGLTPAGVQAIKEDGVVG